MLRTFWRFSGLRCRVQWWVHGAPDVLLAFWGDCTRLHLLSLSLSLSPLTLLLLLLLCIYTSRHLSIGAKTGRTTYISVIHLQFCPEFFTWTYTDQVQEAQSYAHVIFSHASSGQFSVWVCCHCYKCRKCSTMPVVFLTYRGRS